MMSGKQRKPRELQLKFQPFPVLKTPRLTLRQLHQGDEEAVFSLRANESVAQFMLRPLAESMRDARSFIARIQRGIENSESIMWGICEVEQGRVIGTICLWQIRKKDFRAEVGFELLPEFHKKGLMSEALARVMSYAFVDLGLHSLEGQVSPGNIDSIRLLEKHGFVREALFRENCYYNGRFLDTAVYSILAPRSKSLSSTYRRK